MEQIYFAKVRAEAIIPSRRTEDAGFDLYACFAEDTLYFAPGETRVIPTGIASAFDAGFYFQVKERGSTGVLGMAVRAGVIDSGYRGEWFIPITNLSAQPLYLAKKAAREGLEGQRVYPAEKAFCQAIFLQLPSTQVTEIAYETLLSQPSARGAGRLGSSGK